MRAEQALYALLAADAGIAARVASRIYPGQLPQGTLLPALVVEHVDSQPLPTIDAQAGFSLVQSRLQVTALAKTYTDQKAVLDAVRAALNYQRGVIAGVRVMHIVRDTVGPDLRDDDLQVYVQSMDFMVTFQEP